MKYWQFKLGGEVMAISETLKNAVEKKILQLLGAAFIQLLCQIPALKQIDLMKH